MELPSPIFIGFRVKHVPKAKGLGDWFSGGFTDRVIEICSVSDCTAEAPPGSPGYGTPWVFNQAWCYDTEETALATIPLGQAEEYELFAYRLFPVEFPEGGEPFLQDLDKMLSLNSPLCAEPDLRSYQRIGYDAKSYELNQLMMVGCSPLSCNGRAVDVPANRFCLFDDLSKAVEMAKDFANGGGEPGPYHLFEVLRKRSNRWSP